MSSSAELLQDAYPEPSTCLMGVQPEELPILWPTVAPMLAPAIERSAGKVLLEDVFEELLAAQMQLFVAWRVVEQRALGALITHIAVYRHQRVLELLFMGGEQMRAWIGWLPALERWAAEQGCTAVELPGRRGWGRVLRAQYRELFTTFRKEIDDESWKATAHQLSAMQPRET